MRLKTGRQLEKPPRPYLPPLAGCAAFMVCVAAVVLEAAWSSWGDGADARLRAMWAPAGLCAAIGCALVLSGALARRAARRHQGSSLAPRVGAYLVAAGVGALCGAVASGVAAYRRADAARAFAGTPASAYEYVVRGDPVLTDYGVIATADVYEGDAMRATVMLSLADVYEAGVRLRLVGRVKELEAGEWGKRSYMAGEVVEVDVVKVLAVEDAPPSMVDGVRSRILDVVRPADSDERALVAGIVCGRTTEQNASAAQEAFSRTGTTHLIAVSGSHLALVAAIMGMACDAAGLGRRAKLLLMAVVLAWYVLFTGGAASAVRSFVMVAVATMSSLGERRGHGISGLMLAIIVLVFSDAGVVFDLGFQLSCASVLFILVFGGYVAYVIERLGAPRALTQALALTLCAQWATSPLTVPIFGEVSIVAPLANLVLGPVMSLLLIVGLPCVMLAACAPAISELLLVAPLAIARVALFVAEALSAVPWAAIPFEVEGVASLVPYGVACVVYGLWRTPGRGVMGVVAAGVAAFVLVPWLRYAFWAPAEVVVMDVGQGDAIVVREGSHCLMVDAGVDDATAVAIMRNHVSHVDALVITHWDRDHWGGLAAVAALVPIARIVVAPGASDAAPKEVRELGIPIAELAHGDMLAFEGFTCRAVWPIHEVEGEENEDSLVLDVRYERDGQSASVLLTGDAEAEVLEGVVSEVGDIDVLKMGHHGSRASVSPEMLVRLDPEVAVASAGADNPYGHPDPKAVEQVYAAGAYFFCTAESGDVTITPGGNAINVACGRGEGVE